MILPISPVVRRFIAIVCAGVAALVLVSRATPVHAASPGIDSDGDGLSDLDELRFGSDPTKADTDGDGFNDKAEFDARTNPRSTNSFPLFLNSVRDHQRLRGDLLAFRPRTLVDFIVTLDIQSVTNDPPIDPKPDDPPDPQILTITNRITNNVAYQWLRDGHPMSDQTSAGFVLHGARPGDSADYSLRATVLSNVQVGIPIKVRVPNIFPRFRVSQPSGRGSTWGSAALGLGTPPADATNLVALAAGLTHTAAITSAGRVVVWGSAALGQADVPTDLTNAVAIAAGAAHTMALTADGRVVVWGSLLDGALSPPAGLTNVIAIAAGDFHNLALRRDGRVIGWGNNQSRQARPPNGLSDVVRIAAGARHSVALTRDGRILCWGANDLGQLDVPGPISEVKFIVAGGNHSVAVRRNGTLISWGDDSLGQSTPPARLGPVMAVVAGLDFTAARLPGDRLVAWGNKTSPVLTQLPKAITNVLEVAAGPYHLAALIRNPDLDQDDLDDAFETTLGLRTDSADTDGDGLEDALELRLGTRPDRADSDGNGINDLQQLEAAISLANDTDEDGLSDLDELRVGSDPLLADTDGDGFSDALEVDAGTSFRDPTVFPLFRNDVKDKQLLVADTLSLRPTLYLTHRLVQSERVDVVPPGPDDPPGTPDTLKTNLITVTNWVTYQWYHATQPVSGATNPVYFISLTLAEDAGEYHLEARLEAQLQIGKPIQVTILPREATPDGLVNEPLPGTDPNEPPSPVVNSTPANTGRLVAWGGSGFLQGRVPSELVDTPVRHIAAGFAHSVALLATGRMVVWGSDELGQTNQPPGLTNIVGVAAGGGHTLAVSRAGLVTAWGDNRAGQSQVPTPLSPVTMVAAGAFHSLALRTDGIVVAWGDNSRHQAAVPTNLVARQIAAGDFHSVAITLAGTVVCWGDNSAGQCTVPAGLTDVAQVAAGAAHTVARLRNGRVVCWGESRAGQCAVPDTLGAVLAVAAGENFTVALLATGEPVVWGAEGTEVVDGVPPNLIDGFALAAGRSHVLALEPFPDADADGVNDDTSAALGLGANAGDADGDGLSDLNELQLGTNPTNPDTDGDGLNDFLEIKEGFDPLRRDAAAPGSFRLELAQELDFFAAAAGTYQLQITTNDAATPGATVAIELPAGHSRHFAGGTPGDTTVKLFPPIRPSPAPGVVGNVLLWGSADSMAGREAPLNAPGIVEIAAGPRHTVARQSNGAVRSWGRNEEGEATVPSGLNNVTHVAAGAAHSVALRADGQVIAWGRNTAGQSQVPQGLGAAVAIAAGGDVTGAVLSSGRVALWGDNQFGQLNAAAALGTRTVQSISIASTHAAALLTDGRVVCWGDNRAGQCSVPLGLPAATAVLAADQRTLVLLADGTVRCWGADDTGACRPPAGLNDVVQLAASFRHSAALRRDGSVVVWGEVGPQLDLPARLTHPSAIAGGGNVWYAINAFADDDGDSVDDAFERSRQMDPTRRDTDGDGLDDAAELAGGFDPLVPNEAPDGTVSREPAARITLFTLPTLTYRVEASDDLVHWRTVIAPTPNARGFQTNLVSGGTSNAQFFRSRPTSGTPQ